jgi:hypothetical protein
LGEHGEAMPIAKQSAGIRVVPLGQIVCDRRALPREGIDGARTDEFTNLYREELPAGNDPFPAIGCVEDRDGRLVLFDGWHRVAARQRIAAEYSGRGYDEIPVEIVRADGRDPVDFAYELAIGCSAVGSKQLTLSERKAAAKRLSEIRPDLSVREIATRLGISHPTVLRARGSAAISGGGTRVPSPGRLAAAANGEEAPAHKSDQRITLEQRAYRAGIALCQMLDQARDESRGMLGLGKPNMARAGAAAYKALQHSYGEDAPAVTGDLLALVNAMQDQVARGT